MSERSMVYHNGEHGSWRDLVSSIIGLSSAATLFSIQQMQNGFTMLTAPRDGVDRVTRAINSVSHAMTNQVDSTKREAAEDLSDAASKAVDSVMPDYNRAESAGDEAMSGRKR